MRKTKTNQKFKNKTKKIVGGGDIMVKITGNKNNASNTPKFHHIYSRILARFKEENSKKIYKNTIIEIGINTSLERETYEIFYVIPFERLGTPNMYLIINKIHPNKMVLVEEVPNTKKQRQLSDSGVESGRGSASESESESEI